MTSANYTRIYDLQEAAAVALELKDAWSDPSIPAQQWALAEQELAVLRSGGLRPPYGNFLELMTQIPMTERQGLVEVGCGVGHYEDLLKCLKGPAPEYTGVDNSRSMYVWMRTRRRETCFVLAEADALPFADGSFDVAVEGCSMLHNFNYEAALRELFRVSRKWVLLHRVPWSVSGEVEYWQKEAYGVPCLEIHFSYAKLAEFFVKHDLVFVARSEIRPITSADFGISSLLLKKKGAVLP